jgi:hypothetical protein
LHRCCRICPHHVTYLYPVVVFYICIHHPLISCIGTCPIVFYQGTYLQYLPRERERERERYIYTVYILCIYVCVCVYYCNLYFEPTDLLPVPVWSSLYLSLSTCLPVYLSACLPVCLPVCALSAVPIGPLAAPDPVLPCLSSPASLSLSLFLSLSSSCPTCTCALCPLSGRH